MLLKGKAASAFVKRPDPDISCVVIFGEDGGIVSDAARSLIGTWKPKGAPFDVSLADDDTLKKDAAGFFDRLEAVSLLGDARLVRVCLSSEKTTAPLIEAIGIFDSAPQRFPAKLIIEAGGLPSKSKLRQAAEKAKHTACLQFFTDETGDIAARVEAALLTEGAAIAPDALARFTASLPGHRALANSEIEKLCLYAMGLGRPVSLTDVQILSATDAEHDTSSAIRAVLSGEAAAAHQWLDRLDSAGTSAISLLRALQFETLRMIDAHDKIAGGEPNPGAKLRPPVWRSEWSAYQRLLSKWPGRRLMRVLERIHEAEAGAKASSAAAPVIVRAMLNDVLKAAKPAP